MRSLLSVVFVFTSLAGCTQTPTYTVQFDATFPRDGYSPQEFEAYSIELGTVPINVGRFSPQNLVDIARKYLHDQSIELERNDIVPNILIELDRPEGELAVVYFFQGLGKPWFHVHIGVDGKVLNQFAGIAIDGSGFRAMVLSRMFDRIKELESTNPICSGRGIRRTGQRWERRHRTALGSRDDGG